MKKLIARKIKMTQVFKDDAVVPVSVVKLGKENDLAGLEVGGFVRISGISKGKGFQGVVKRHGFHGGPKTHGQKDRYRAGGSIGATTPQRVVKGRKMAGRMGGDRITLKKVKVVEMNKEDKELLLKGAIPGNNGDKVEVSF